LSTEAAKELRATFKQNRQTPGTVVYKEVVSDDSAEVIGSLYIKKVAAKDLGDPKSIVVTVSAA
jgi:hypothetical protein